MIQPDLIISWPRNCDYPLWRQFIRDNREKFNVVIIAFTETHMGEDYREFIKSAMQDDWVLFVESPAIQRDQDWRNVAINNALMHSYNAEWVWFTEQDFLITDPNYFWNYVNETANLGYEVIGVKEGEDRIHPCCLFVKRTALNKTSKNFGIVPNKLDHFGVFTQELMNHPDKIKIDTSLKFSYKHLAGLSHNMRLIADGEMPNHDVNNFNDYLIRSLSVQVPQDERFKMLVSNYLNRTSSAVSL